MKTDIMGIAFDNVTMQQALEKAGEILAGDKTCYAVTPNAEIAYEALRDESLRALLNEADLVLPDGAGVVLASKILKTPLQQKVAGVDFADGLLGMLAQNGKSVYLLGSKPGIAELAAEKMREKHPGLTICGMHDGYFKDEAPVIAAINEAKPDVFCLPRSSEAGAFHEAAPERSFLQADDRARRVSGLVRGNSQTRAKMDDQSES